MKYSESENAGESLVYDLTPDQGSEDVSFPFSFLPLLGTNSSGMWEEGLGLTPVCIPMAV